MSHILNLKPLVWFWYYWKSEAKQGRLVGWFSNKYFHLVISHDLRVSVGSEGNQGYLEKTPDAQPGRQMSHTESTPRQNLNIEPNCTGDKQMF